MKPKVGMGITIQVGSDRYAGTIISVAKSGKSFIYRRDPFLKVVGDHPLAKPERAFQRDDGKWYYKFGSRTHHAWHITLGVRDEYRDPSF